MDLVRFLVGYSDSHAYENTTARWCCIHRGVGSNFSQQHVAPISFPRRPAPLAWHFPCRPPPSQCADPCSILSMDAELARLPNKSFQLGCNIAEPSTFRHIRSNLLTLSPCSVKGAMEGQKCRYWAIFRTGTCTWHNAVEEPCTQAWIKHRFHHAALF